MKICPKCSYRSETAEFCRECGAEMVTAPSLRAKLAWHSIGTFAVWLICLLAVRRFAGYYGYVDQIILTCLFFLFLFVACIVVSSENFFLQRAGQRLSRFIISEISFSIGAAIIIYFIMLPSLRLMGFDEEFLIYVHYMRTPAIITIPFLSFNLAMGFYLINIRKRKHFVLLCSFKVVVLIVTAILCISLWRIGIVVSVVLAELLSAALAIILLAKSRAKK